MNVISSTVKHKLKLLTNRFDCLHFGFFLLIRYIFLYFSLLKNANDFYGTDIFLSLTLVSEIVFAPCKKKLKRPTFFQSYH